MLYGNLACLFLKAHEECSLQEGNQHHSASILLSIKWAEITVTTTFRHCHKCEMQMAYMEEVDKSSANECLSSFVMVYSVPQ